MTEPRDGQVRQMTEDGVVWVSLPAPYSEVRRLRLLLQRVVDTCKATGTEYAWYPPTVELMDDILEELGDGH